MIQVAIIALKAALTQIMLAVLTSAFLKEIILVGLKKLVTKTDNQVDDQIVKLVDDAVHNRLPEANHDEKVCSKCKAVLD